MLLKMKGHEGHNKVKFCAAGTKRKYHRKLGEQTQHTTTTIARDESACNNTSTIQE